MTAVRPNERSLPPRPALRASVVALVLVTSLLSCNSGSEIIAIDNSRGGFQLEKKKSSSERNSDLQIDGEGNISTEADPDGNGSANAADARVDDSSDVLTIEYPQLGFNAGGFTTCKGDTYQTTASIVTNMDANKLDLTMTAAKVYCGGRCQGKADEEVQKSIGVTHYERTQKAQKDALIKQGFVDGPFAIFGNNVTKVRDNQRYNFDKPVPVFPWPAAKSRYDTLNAGPMQWTANVTGAANFSIVVKVTKVGEQGDVVTLKFETTIQQDQDHSLYENFPMPRQAIYTVDTVNRDVRQINSLNLFNGEKCDNKPERVEMIYKMCTKTKKGKTQNFPCS